MISVNMEMKVHVCVYRIKFKLSSADEKREFTCKAMGLYYATEAAVISLHTRDAF